MHRLLIPFALLACWPYPVRADAIAEAVRASLDAWKVPGAVVVVVRDDKPVHVAGHGRVRFDHDGPPTADTLFPLASCSKAFTTALMAKLADEGKLGWDDLVRTHLRGFRLDEPRADAMVTLRDLVTHRTGLGTHDLLWYRAPWPPDEMVRRAGRLPLSHPFRSRFEYQSVMVTAAGLACAEAGARTWHELIQRHLFDPLGMKTATCRPGLAAKGNAATGHRVRDGKVEAVPWYAPEVPNPAGSVVVSGNDLVPWLRFHLAGGRLGDERIVSEGNLGETHAPQVVLRMEGLAKELNPETVQLSYAMGWVVQDYRGRLMLSHGGVIDGFRAHLALLPRERLGVAVLTNLGGTRMNQALSHTLVDQLLGLERRDWDARLLAVVAEEEQARRDRRRAHDDARRPDLPPSLPLAAYAGRYRHRAYGDAVVSLADGKLIWAWSGFRAELRPHHGDAFEPVGDDFLEGQCVEFRPDGSGRVASLKAAGEVFERQ